MPKIIKFLSYLALLLIAVSSPVSAMQPFVIEDIELEGLQRISAGTVFNYLPAKVGDRFDSARASESIRALFKTGFFKDVRLERDGNILLVILAERPAIADITFDGNKSIDTDAIKEVLKQVGFYEGQVFDRSILDRVELEMRQQYFAQGKYGVRISKTITPLERNRVSIAFDISEGRVAKITQLNVIGNTDFDEKKLLKKFTLQPTGFFSFYSRNDQYSKSKLAADLETLRTFYLNRGYVNFNIDSTQVSITPNKKHVYITVNISEGKVHTIGTVNLAGELKPSVAELEKLVKVAVGDTFSRNQISKTTEAITQLLGDEGYAFANVNAIPEINSDDQTVAMTFFVDPGKRVYVNRVNFIGNKKTRDEVLRREMRQMEGGWISTSQVKRSQTRLRRTGFFEEVNVETPAVPGTPDQVDVNFSVTERPSGTIIAGAGFSQSEGLVFSGSLTQDNFLGTGKRVSTQVNTSSVNTVYSLSFDDPYFTVDGVSAGFTGFFRETNAEEANVTNFTADVIGGSVRLGFPVNEFDFINTELGYENTKINTLFNSSTEILNFIARNGAEYDTIKVSTGFSHDTRNKAIFPDRGLLQRVTTEFALPGGDLNFYKVNVKQDWYYPVSDLLTLLMKGQIAYGDAYGDSEDYPFFENFYAGGPRSVHGYEENTLGPRDSRNEPLGGNLKIVGNAVLILPPPFDPENKAVRLTAFFDMGNVFGSDEDFDTADLRYSMGVSAVWLSPLGALTFSYAIPFNDKRNDETQPFQFTFGTSF